MPNRVTIALASLSAVFLAIPSSATTPKAPSGPPQLSALLAKYDAMKPGPDREKLADEIDHVAGQRYATVSRLYWYQNLDEAKGAAAKQHRPILHLRMLGRLDEDLSCANSRFFRATLYANAETSKFLRDNFVLYWSSERPVPRVTIDFGDGRKIERTTTGNSAHYVMDERGHVLDVLPGLYAPIVFRTELAKSLELAKQVRKLDDKALLDAVLAFHEKEVAAANKQFAGVGGIEYIARRGRLIGASELGAAAVQRAQAATMTKAFVEVPDLQKLGIDAGSIDPQDLAQWATIGQKVWNIGLSPKAPQPSARTIGYNPPAMLLDTASIGLVEKLRSGNPTTADSAATIARLEQMILADTALNQFRLRHEIRMHLLRDKRLDFASLNDVIYANVFHTPKTDAWLGLLENTDFTGLPADGVVMH
jgi:hypothetical protein